MVLTSLFRDKLDRRAFWTPGSHPTSSTETCCVFLLLFLLTFEPLAPNYLQLGVMLFIHETPGWLLGLESVTGASIGIVVRRKRVNFQFRG